MMIRTLVLATVLCAATGAAMAAQDGAAFGAGGPRLVGGGNDSAEVEYGGAPMGGLVGGGSVMQSGGANERMFSFGRVNAQPGRFATITGGGDSQQVIDAAPGPQG